MATEKDEKADIGDVVEGLEEVHTLIDGLKAHIDTRFQSGTAHPTAGR